MPFKRGNIAALGADHSTPRIVRQALISELNCAAKDGMTPLRRIVRKLLEAAEDGDMKAIELIFDRVDGRPSQEAHSEPAAPPLALTEKELEALRQRILQGHKELMSIIQLQDQDTSKLDELISMRPED
jgi:hypothetical protein